MRNSTQRLNYEANRITLKGDLCIYCGDIATTIEHFPPVCITNSGFKLPSCTECNNFAVDENPRHFERRIESVKSKIRRKNWKWLQIPEWSHEELSEMSPIMRRDIINALNKKNRTIKRLEHDSLAYLAVIDLEDQFQMFFDRVNAA